MRKVLALETGAPNTPPRLAHMDFRGRVMSKLSPHFVIFFTETVTTGQSAGSATPSELVSVVSRFRGYGH